MSDRQFGNEDNVEDLDTTEEHLAIFKRAVLYWAEVLGVGWVRFDFHHGCDKERYAQISFDNDVCVARAMLTKKWCPDRALNEIEITALARHEVAHLLVAELEWAAGDRYTTRREVDAHTERLTRRIERVYEMGYRNGLVRNPNAKSVDVTGGCEEGAPDAAADRQEVPS